MQKITTTSAILNTIISTLITACILSACTPAKELSYFQDLPNTETVNLPSLPKDERIIEGAENLYISFSAKDNQAAGYFNKAGGNSPLANISGEKSESTTAGANTGNDYLVNDAGYLEFPIIGKVKVAGLTAEQLKQNLTKSVAPYLKDPLVEVRFNTFRISVLGEVRTPGIHTLPMQRTTLFEALASAGDLPLTAQRYDVELYRDYNGIRKIYKIDLRKTDVLNNPEIFQIKHNDVLYVKPRASAVSRENTAFVTSIISLILGVITLAATFYFNK